MKDERSIYITIRIDVNANTELSDSDIVSELNYNISSFDEDVTVTNTEICGINQ